MADGVKSDVNITTLAPDSSPSDFLDDKKIQRSLFKISSAQKQLLNRNNLNTPDPSGSQSSSPLRAEEDDEDGGGDDASELISWASSLEQNLRPPSVKSQEPMQPFMTQLPENSPPQPTIVTSPLPVQHPKLPEFPPSSQGLEDELEVEVPGALAYNPEPINNGPTQNRGYYQTEQ
ncbi:hypothetical protein ONZ43_g289 [Nemania bipapillata]|uniref:Uncharacterized protein n=1 Tax=Nemania bipapillata TaxID=110536 RepID=A0ACC2J8P1_9PEZI|nr:hypothetical protein ONZ43_g289 [Nemania bipapillata]